MAFSSSNTNKITQAPNNTNTNDEGANRGQRVNPKFISSNDGSLKFGTSRLKLKLKPKNFIFIKSSVASTSIMATSDLKKSGIGNLWMSNSGIHEFGTGNLNLTTTFRDDSMMDKFNASCKTLAPQDMKNVPISLAIILNTFRTVFRRPTASCNKSKRGS